jgi:histidinol-phosphate aminotransferase
MSSVAHLLRPELRDFTAYHAASPRRGVVRLHANESSWRAAWDDTDDGLNRYPDPRPAALVGALAALYGVAPGAVLATRGSDDAIDLLVRAFCRAGQDAVLVCPPTFGMYAVAARLQGADVIEVPLRRNFVLDVRAIETAVRPGVKLVFLCSPNNPTGSTIPSRVVEALCRALDGHCVVVVDEAYIEFAREEGLASRLGDPSEPRAVAHPVEGLGARGGAHRGAARGARAGRDPARARAAVSAALRRDRGGAAAPAARQSSPRPGAARRGSCAGARRWPPALRSLPAVRRVWPSEGNFLLVRCADAAGAMAACESAGVLVRDFSRVPRLRGCLRITVGHDRGESSPAGCARRRWNPATRGEPTWIDRCCCS